MALKKLGLIRISELMYITKSLGYFVRAAVIISRSIGVPYLFTAGIDSVETFIVLQ